MKNSFTTEYFIERAIEIHGSKYDYSESIYTKSTSKVKITCKIHGVYEQTPNIHLKGSGCTNCNNKFKLTSKSFIIKAKLKHNDLYDYSKVIYKNTDEKVKIICKIHGEFNQTPHSHLSGRKCPNCSISLKKDINYFIEEAHKLHGKRYDYSVSSYIDSGTKVTIKCEIHGFFKQLPNSHLGGQGCPICANLNKGYTKSSFKNRCLINSQGIGTLYIIRCFNDSEEFYKIGITSNTVKHRFSSSRSLPYHYDIVREIKNCPIVIYDTENEILRKFIDDKYEPLIDFAGQTECFSKVEAIEKYLRHKELL